MSARDLGGPLLASVSRSFYLTICILPAALRAPIGLAYLLARASDTIADTADAPPALRLQHLAAFGQMVATGTRDGLPALQRDLRATHPGEAELLARLGEALDWLAALPAADRAEIAAVLAQIIRGQSLDLERFADSTRIVALPDAAALDEYTYLVAGCVGEFWTRLCLQHLPRYATMDAPELTRLGIRYGQGLQLVNILRDSPADLRAGRCYLPADELRAAGADPATLLTAPQPARPVFAHWLARAEAHLEDGRRYLRALRPARLRVGCFLPWHLGVKTLALLRAQSPLETGARLKVPRSTVRAALLLAVPVAFSNLPLRKP